MRDNSKNKVIFLREEYADGEGKFIYPNRSKYEGHWENGLREGFGVHTLSDRSKYVGQHLKGLGMVKVQKFFLKEKNIQVIGKME